MKTSVRPLNRTSKWVSEQWPRLALRYWHEATGIPNVVWYATDRLCSKRLQTFLPGLVDIPLGQGKTLCNTRSVASDERSAKPGGTRDPTVQIYNTINPVRLMDQINHAT